jgi:uncharacterized protein
LRAVLDPNVIVSAALSATGSPARVIRRWLDGDFEVVVSPALLDELRRVLTYPKIAERVPANDAEALLALLEAEAAVAPDPSGEPPVSVEDPGDEYLISLAVAEGAALVSGDRHLLDLAAELPIYGPADFLACLGPTVPGS